MKLIQGKHGFRAVDPNPQGPCGKGGVLDAISPWGRLGFVLLPQAEAWGYMENFLDEINL